MCSAIDTFLYVWASTPNTHKRSHPAFDVGETSSPAFPLYIFSWRFSHLERCAAAWDSTPITHKRSHRDKTNIKRKKTRKSSPELPSYCSFQVAYLKGRYHCCIQVYISYYTYDDDNHACYASHIWQMAE